MTDTEFTRIYLSDIRSVTIYRDHPNLGGTDLTVVFDADHVAPDRTTWRVNVIFEKVKQLSLGDMSGANIACIRIQDTRASGLEDMNYKVFEEEFELIEFTCGQYLVSGA